MAKKNAEEPVEFVELVGEIVTPEEAAILPPAEIVLADGSEPEKDADGVPILEAVPEIIDRENEDAVFDGVTSFETTEEFVDSLEEMVVKGDVVDPESPVGIRVRMKPRAVARHEPVPPEPVTPNED